jgi:hypothetical protein
MNLEAGQSPFSHRRADPVSPEWRISHRKLWHEAANKCISQVRLKRSGAWWYIKQANRVLALRGHHLQRHLCEGL